MGVRCLRPARRVRHCGRGHCGCFHLLRANPLRGQPLSSTSKVAGGVRVAGAAGQVSGSGDLGGSSDNAPTRPLLGCGPLPLRWLLSDRTTRVWTGWVSAGAAAVGRVSALCSGLSAIDPCRPPLIGLPVNSAGLWDGCRGWLDTRGRTGSGRRSSCSRGRTAALQKPVPWPASACGV